MTGDYRLSRWALRLDGAFLMLAGTAAMLSEILGHFFGIGPLAAIRGSPNTIGGFEAHGLALLIGVLLLRSATLPDRKMWHIVGLITHIFLGTCNLLFWYSFIHHGMLRAGYVTTALHSAFAVAHVACLLRQRRSHG